MNVLPFVFTSLKWEQMVLYSRMPKFKILVTVLIITFQAFIEPQFTIETYQTVENKNVVDNSDTKDI